MNIYDENNLCFPVEVVKVGAILPTGRYIDTDRQAVVRRDTDEILGIHGAGYKLLRNEDAFLAFTESLVKSKVDLTDAYCTNEVSHNGARTYKTYTFPSHSVPIHGKNDLVNLKLQVINSYDGSLAFQTMLGAYRILCSNGMVIGDTYLQTSSKHTKSLNLDDAVKQLNHSLSAFMDSTAKWRFWSNVKVEHSDVSKVLKAIPELNSDKVQNKILHYYLNETETLGETVWAFFNALTHWSTHEPVSREGSEANIASIRLAREKRVQQAINSNAFKALERKAA